MPVLEARARVLGALALVLAAGAFIATRGLWTADSVDVPNAILVGGLVAVVAAPGFLLGRTGVPGRIGVVAYETVLAYLAAAVVATGIVLGPASAIAATSGVVDVAAAVATTLTTSWAPWGIAGYVVGLASTVLESVLGW